MSEASADIGGESMAAREEQATAMLAASKEPVPVEPKTEPVTEPTAEPEMEVVVNDEVKGDGDGTDREALRKREEAVQGKVEINVNAAAAEGLPMFMFVVIGCGVACAHGATDPASRLVVAFAFGVGILVLAYGFAHHSGAQINCAVTLALVLAGRLPRRQGLLNFAFQLFGSVCGAIFLAMVFPCDVDMTKSLGTNIVNDDYGIFSALFGEIFGTFLLCFTVFETAANPKANVGINYGIAIGFAVFLAHLILLPIDGCSINPTRSFGPAIVGAVRNCDVGPGMKGVWDLWLMFLGPSLGSAIAAGVKKMIVQSDLSGESEMERE